MAGTDPGPSARPRRNAPTSSAAVPGPRPAGSPMCSAPRPSAAHCCWGRPLAPWPEPTHPSGAYDKVRDTVVGSVGHLDLTCRALGGDGLLAIFFFVAGLELKREFVAGDLRDPRSAVLPVVAAVGGMVVPALVYVAVVCLGGGGALQAGRSRRRPTSPSRSRCWRSSARHLPAALRTFLLTLAVVDDLLAITIIAIFYTADLQLGALLLALVPLGAVRRAGAAPDPVLVAAAAAGVRDLGAGARLRGARHRRRRAAGLRRAGRARDGSRAAPDAGHGLAEHFEHRCRPISAGVAVPIFALLRRRGHRRWPRRPRRRPDRPGGARHRGRPGGRQDDRDLRSTCLVARFTRAELDDDLAWSTSPGSRCSPGSGSRCRCSSASWPSAPGSARDDHVKVAVLVGSVIAALLASGVAPLRNRVYRRIGEDEDARRRLRRHPRRLPA